MSAGSATGFAAHGGLPLQIAALSELFDATRIVGPGLAPGRRAGETAIAGKRVSVVTLAWLPRSPGLTWLILPFWLVANARTLAREIARADAVYPLIPSPIGILGLLFALILRKRIVTRQLNSWSDPRPLWRMQRAVLERIAGGRNVVFATGADRVPPSVNPAIRWLFSSTVRERDVAALGIPRRLEAGRHRRLIIAGREVDIEATATVLRAYSMLSAEFPDATLDVVGNGAALSKTRRLAAEMVPDGRVTFHGPLDQERLFELLRQVDLFCLPAVETEAFRQTVHEALACGIPLVATRDSVLPALLDTGCGVFLDDKTPAALATAVTACLRDPERYRRMSSAAVETAKAYTLERWRETIRSALQAAWGPLQSTPDTGATVEENMERSRR
jgi:glycosyltransferase involved in cell wall biosynthesis